RRGQVRIDRNLSLRGTTVHLEHLELGGDSAKLHLRTDPPADVAVSILADGERLEELGVEHDDGSGRTRITTYPVLRSHRSIHVDVRGATVTVDVPLPE
ncbi:MAG TPA: hypothetical protein VEC09_00160, partial [Actinomycetota bacterium]|nr:hypothetical protein [Actinomycetota bacterium]